MKGHWLFIAALLPILGLMVHPGLNYSVEFGWHTKILTENSVETMWLISAFIGIIIIYWMIDKDGKTTIVPLTLLHFILTVAPVYWLLFSSDIIRLFVGDATDSLLALGEYLLAALTLAYLMLVIGQLLFIINIGVGIKNKLHINKMR